MGTIYRNGQYYGGSSGGATAELDRHEIGYGNDESNIVGSGLFTKKNANIVEDLCEEQQSNSLEFIIDSTTDGDMPAGTITISNGTLETDYDSTQYVKDYEGHGYIGPILYQVTSGQNYGIKFSFETFNKVLADKDYYLSFVGYEDYANLSFHKTVESVTESGATVYNVTCTANTKDAFEGQIVFPPTTGQDLAIYNGNADQDGGKFFLKNKGILCIGGNNLTALDGNTRFTMHDSAEMDLTGGVNRPNAGPKVYMHGEAQVNFDDGRYWVGPEYRPYYTFVSETVTYDEPKDENYSFSYVSHDPSYTYYDGQRWITLTDLNGGTTVYGSNRDPRYTKFCLTPSYRCGVEDMEYYSVEEKTRSVYDDSQKKTVTKYYYIVKRKFVVSNGVQPSVNRVRLNENKDPLIKIMDGPQVFMSGFPTVQLEDKSKIRMSSDGMITIDQGSHLQMNGQISEGTQWYDRRDMKWKRASQMAGEIGSLSENQFGNELNIEGANLIRFHGTEFTNEVNIEGCKINIGVKNTSGGAPQILIKENVDIDIGGVEQIRCEGVPKHRGGTACNAAVIKICDRSEVQLHGYSLLDLKDATTLRLKNNTLVEMGDNSSIETTGNSRIALQDVRKTGGYGSPVINGDPNQFMFGAFGMPCDNSPYILQSFDDGGADCIYHRLVPWEEGEVAIAKIREEQYYRRIIATTEEDINKLNTIFSKYASQVDEDKQYYSYIKTTNMCYITDEEHEAFMTWAQNKYGTGNYNYNRCNVIFTQRYVLKPEKRQEFYELTKELETIYTSYSTWSGWYPIITANGQDIDYYFDILWQKYDYYYQSYGYYYDGYYYYNKPTPNKTFEYISSGSSYASAFTQILKNHPEYKDCISYIESDSMIYPYTVIDMDKFNELKSNFSKFTSDKLFSNIYDNEGNVISRSLSSKTVTESVNYCSKELAKYKGYMFCIQGDSRVIIGSSNGSSFQTDSEWTNSRGKLYIDIKPTKSDDNMNILMSDSIFVQATGNSHIESHDNSTVVMRGNLPIVNGKKKKPWTDGVVNWTRPVQSKGDSPIVGLYDAPTVLIRGTWDTEDDDALNPKPEDWVEHPEKQEGSPIVEIIEDSELRFYGSSSIKMDDEGITFGNATGTASFTIEELNNLKNGSGGGTGEDNPPYELPAATNTTLGGVKVGKGLSINDNGVLSANAQELTPATEETLGGVKIGNGLEVLEDGTLSIKNFSSNKYIEGNAVEFKESSSSTSILPEEYQQLEYIEGTGLQYLVIPYCVKMEDTIEMEVYMTQGTSKWEWAFGSIHKTDASINQCEWICRYNDADGVIYYIRYDRATHGESSLGSFPLFTKFKVTAYKENMSLEFSPDNVRNYSSQYGMSGDAISNLMLFGCNVSMNTDVDECFTGDGIGLAHYRLYSFRILDSDKNVLYDMIPCKEKSSGDIGIYNVIDSTFIKSKTSVNFMGGPNVAVDTSINVKYDPTTLAINENNELTVIEGNSNKNTEYVGKNGIEIYEQAKDTEIYDLLSNGSSSEYGWVNEAYSDSTSPNPIAWSKELLLTKHIPINTKEVKAISVKIVGTDGSVGKFGYSVHFYDVTDRHFNTLISVPGVYDLGDGIHKFTRIDEFENTSYIGLGVRNYPSGTGNISLSSIYSIQLALYYSEESVNYVELKHSDALEINKNGELDLKIKIVPCTQEQYDALEVKDPNTLYLIGD